MSGDERPPATLGTLGHSLALEQFKAYEQALQRACVKRGIEYTPHNGEAREAMFAALGRKLFRESKEAYAGPRGRPRKQQTKEIELLKAVNRVQLRRLEAIIDHGRTELKPLTSKEALEAISGPGREYMPTRLPQLSRARAEIAKKSKPIKRK